MPSCLTDGIKHLHLFKKMDKRSTMARDLSESSLVSNRAVQMNKGLAKGKHAQVCKLSPSPQSRQPILLSLFFLL